MKADLEDLKRIAEKDDMLWIPDKVAKLGPHILGFTYECTY